MISEESLGQSPDEPSEDRSGGLVDGQARALSLNGVRIEDIDPVDINGHVSVLWSQMSGTVGRPGALAQLIMRVPEDSVLGEGSYGLVWRGLDRRSRVTYAVKNVKTHRRGTECLVAQRESQVAELIRLR